ncbi:MAG TPA: potassium channel family protein [Chloroflexota bacterium]|nr:potassium channel family protein [Chloroflexota bacterium]
MLRFRRALDVLVVLAAMVSVPLTIAELHGNEEPIVLALDWAIWAVFVADAALIGYTALDWRTRLRRGWVAYLLVLLTFPAAPTLLHGLRLVRLLRIVRLLRLAFVAARAVRVVKRTLGHRGFLDVALVNAVVIAAGAGATAAVEPDVVKGDYWNGLWWAVVTATTVGYGDISPSSAPGRLVAAVLMFTGIGLISTMAATITALFVEQEERSEFQQVQERLARIEALLERKLGAGAKS